MISPVSVFVETRAEAALVTGCAAIACSAAAWAFGSSVV